MNINPIASYNKNNNQPSFQAVNMKYLERAQKEIYWGKSITTDLLMCLRYDVMLFRKISPEDGIDTLKAIRKLLGGKTDEGFNYVLSNLREERKLRRKEEKLKAKKST